jgi:hypothetical protein
MGENAFVKRAAATDKGINGKFVSYFTEAKSGLARHVLPSSLSNPFTNYIARPNMDFELRSVIHDLIFNSQLPIGAQRSKVART